MDRPVRAQTVGVGAGEPRQWRALAWASEHPQIVALVLDGTGLAVIGATLLGFGHQDFNFHIVWVLLCTHAFVLGLRSTLIRILIATGSLAVYAAGYEAGWIARELDLIEWPLMFVIAVIVAVLAGWRTATARRYARLYRLTSDRLITAQEEERGRLALDLHDGVGQTLTALGLTLEALQSARAAERPALLGHARELVAEATGETRDVAERLRPIRLDGIGLAATIRRLAARAGMPVRVNVTSKAAEGPELAPDVAVIAFRVVQEALSNAARHAHAGSVTISMARRGQTLSIEVADDGRGFTMGNAGTRGLGIPGMRERAAMIGASLSLRSAPGGGTRVRLAVPVVRAEAEDPTAADRGGPPVVEPVA
jgi:signal transduction histidine kinase